MRVTTWRLVFLGYRRTGVTAGETLPWVTERSSALRAKSGGGIASSAKNMFAERGEGTNCPALPFVDLLTGYKDKVLYVVLAVRVSWCADWQDSSSACALERNLPVGAGGRRGKVALVGKARPV